MEYGTVRRSGRELKGNRAYATYVEALLSVCCQGVDMKAGIGIVPWNAYGTYGIDRDFYVQNVFLNAGKSLDGGRFAPVGTFYLAQLESCPGRC